MNNGHTTCTESKIRGYIAQFCLFNKLRDTIIYLSPRMQLFAYELRRVWNWKSQMISKYVYTGNNPEYLALDDRKAVGCSFNQWLRHNTPGLSCHLDANILICRSRNHVLYVKCLLAAYWSITQSVTNLCMM